jgi:hypothetical protein
MAYDNELSEMVMVRRVERRCAKVGDSVQKVSAIRHFGVGERITR